MLRSFSALLTRPAALVTSTVLHVGAIVAGGHALSEGPEGRPSASAPVEIDIQLSDQPSALAAPSTPEEKPRVPAALRAGHAGHRHAYPVPADHDAHPHDPSLVHLVGGATPAAVREVAPPPHFVLASETLTTRGAADQARAGSASALGDSSGGDSSGSGAGASGAPLPESAVDTPARVLSTVPVVYPEAARTAGIEADVLLELVVDREGRVARAQLLSAPSPGLADAAARAVRAYRFTPARRGGRAVPVRMRWTVTFRLQ